MSFINDFFGDFTEYRYLLDIALILISTKVLGIIAKKFQMPQVVGALAAGLILGPILMIININTSEGLRSMELFGMIAEIGVIILMFQAGVETNIKELKKVGKAGLVVAFIGVIVPLGMGFLLSFLFNDTKGLMGILQNIFIGVILTATSVSITVETLKEMGKLNTKVGNTILAAALIDDILGLIALTLVTSFVGVNINIMLVVLKIIIFFGLSVGLGIGFSYFFKWYTHRVGEKNMRRFPLLAFVYCLLMAFMAELFGVADIIGAFIAGIVVASTPKAKYIESRISPLSYLLLAPIFFANVGLRVVFPDFSWGLVFFGILLILVAILSKLVGCGLGARLCKFNFKESVQVGFGMACRGEVALIVAHKGGEIIISNIGDPIVHLMAEKFLGPVVLMIVFISIVAPILLKLVFKEKTHKISSGLVESITKVDTMDNIASNILCKNEDVVVEAT